MSSNNIEIKTLSETTPVTQTYQNNYKMSSNNIEIKTLSETTPVTQTYDVKKETNPNIRYLMSYYGY